MNKNSGRAGSGVYKDENNGTWTFRVVRDKNYKRTGFRTRAEAVTARIEFIKKYDMGHGLIRDMTLDQVFNIYMEEGILSCAEGTIRKKISVYTHHISPVFGKRLISGLHPGEINLFLESCYVRGDKYNDFSKGYSFGYVEGFLKCFYALFGFAFRKNMISRDQYNECLNDESERISMPRMKDLDSLRKRQGAKVFSEKEISMMRARITGFPLSVAFEIGLNCGLRVSEVFALTWSDIDLDNGVLKVDKQLLSIDGEWCFCQPKYISSYRTVFINDHLKRILIESKKRQEFERAFAKTDYLKGNNVIDRRAGGAPKELFVEDFLLVDDRGRKYNSSSFKHWSKVFRRELGIKDFTFHSLRHTFCSQVAALNCPVSELCRMAGHNSIETTMTYYINSTKLGEDAARRVLNLLNPIKRE